VLEQHGGFDETFTVWDNIELNFRLYLNGVRFQFLERVGLVYRDDRTISRITDNENWHSEEMYRDLSRMLRYAQSRGQLAGQIKDPFVKRCYAGGKSAAAHGELDLAKRYFALLEEASPGRRLGSTPSRILDRIFGPAFAAYLTGRSRRLLSRR
jgi:hypothetical protein